MLWMAFHNWQISQDEVKSLTA